MSSLPLVLWLLCGPASAGDDLQVYAQVLLEQPDTLITGGLIGPPQSRATWYFFGDVDPAAGNAMMALSTGDVDAPPLPGADLGPGGIAGDEAGIFLSLRVPDDAHSLRLRYRAVVPVDGALPAEDEAQWVVVGAPGLPEGVADLDPYGGGFLGSHSAAVLAGDRSLLAGTPWSENGRLSAWMEAIVRVEPGSLVTPTIAVRDRGDDPLGDFLLLADGLAFDSGVPEGVSPGRIPRLESVVPPRVPTGADAPRIVLEGRDFPPDLSVEATPPEAAALPLPATWRSAERVVVDVAGLPAASYGLRLRWSDGAILWPEALEIATLRPSIDAIVPATGPTDGSTRAVIEGEGFVGDVRVVVGEADAVDLQVRGTTRLDFVVPAGPPGEADVLVFAGGDFVEVPGGFRYAEAAPLSEEEPPPPPELVVGCGLAGRASGWLLPLILLIGRRRGASLPILLLALLLAGPAVAEEGDDDDSASDPVQEEAPPTPPEITERVTVTATGEARLLSDAPVPVRLIDEETVRRSPAGDVAELLSRAPGIPVMSQGVDQRGGASGISLQGLPAGRTLVLVDGRPVAGDTGGIVDLGQFPAAMLERIEIVEGPMSALYGSDALGGVINLITRQPRGGASFGGRLQAATDRTVDINLHGEASDPSGLAATATVSWKRAEFIDLVPADAATDADSRSVLSVRTGVSWGNDITRLDGAAQWTADEREGVSLRLNNAIGHPEVYDSPKRYDRVTLGGGQRIRLGPAADFRWHLDGTLYHSTFREELRDSIVTRERRTSIDQVNQLSRFDLHAVPGLSLAAGLEWSTESLGVQRDAVEPGSVLVHEDEVLPTREWALEPWLQGDLRLFADRLEIVPGVRMTVHDAFGVNAAPSLALRLKLWDRATLRLSGARGYRAPSLKDRYLQFDHSALGYVVEGDPGLLPESSWGLNLSFEQAFGRVATLRAGAFANRIENLITFVNAGVTSGGAPLNLFRAANIEGARTVGAQATGDLDLPFLRVTASYRFLWAWSDGGFFLPDSPVHAVRGTVQGIVAKIGLSVYTAVGFESERFVDEAQQLRSPGLVRWDARIEKTFTGRHELAVYVGVDNILDQRRDPGLEGDFRPVTGRRLIGGLRGRLVMPGADGRPGVLR